LQKVITKKEMVSKMESFSLYILYLCLLSLGDAQISVELNKFL